MDTVYYKTQQIERSGRETMKMLSLFSQNCESGLGKQRDRTREFANRGEQAMRLSDKIASKCMGAESNKIGRVDVIEHLCGEEARKSRRT